MGARFITHDEQLFGRVLGSRPTLELLLEDNRYPFAHEASVYLSETDELFITSNRFCDEGSHQQRVQISKVIVGGESRRGRSTTRQEVNSSQIPLGNGGVNYGEDSVLFCAQGSMDMASGLYAMSARAPHTVTPVLLDSHGRPFNSVNDVVKHTDGSIWFTDPPYGFEQGYRPRPSLPSQVYRYDPQSGSIRAVTDGFGHPNGLCFSPDEKMMYITDTDRWHGSGVSDYSKASTIHAFDVTVHHGQSFLANRRLFAFADSGIPDGIKCDMEGNVYSGCGDGVNVWSPGGVLLGRIAVDGGVANFCFGRRGEVFLMNETRLWRAQLGSHVRGALLGI